MGSCLLATASSHLCLAVFIINGTLGAWKNVLTLANPVVCATETFGLQGIDGYRKNRFYLLIPGLYW